MFRLSILFLGLLGSLQLLGQNLVVNPSFEEGNVCDGESSELDSIASWQALAGSPRFLNPQCPLSNEEKVYIQAIKMPNAVEGDAYVGMGIDREGEYLGGQLSSPLEAGKQYWVKLRIRLPIRFCNKALDELGVVLTDSVIAPQQKYATIDMPSLKLVSNDMSPIEEQLKWQEISALYIAKGGEDKIIIGNFADNNVENFKKREPKECSYVYIDLVEVSEFKEISLKPYNNNAELSAGARYILKDLEFEPGLEKIKDGFKTLDGLAERLVEKPELRIEVSGHTDNVADESVNLQFSKARAESVMDYLIAKGVKSAQIVAEGKGSSMNIAVNQSENGRKKNNRVEVKVLE
jgi:outer membrane protein OmpA-like peptidoglycan-associated protein